MPLRSYQNDALAAIRTQYAAGFRRQLLCMATGTGKTEVFTHLPEATKDILPGQMMVLLHRDELAQQAYNKLTLRNPTYRVHIEAGESHADPDADVIIASVQTLGREGTTRNAKFNYNAIDKYVVDEAHRSIAQSYYNVYNAAGLLRPDNKRLLLGVTATPVRGNGEGLGSLYQCIPYTYTLRQGIEDGYLVDVRGIRVDTQVSLDGIKTTDGDYDKKQLANTVNTPLRNALIASAYLEHCVGRQAVGFSVDIQHAKDLAETFQKYGINAQAVWGKDPLRAQKIEQFRNGDIQVLFNAELLTEGFDLDAIECVILGAPTKSGVVFSQRVGRGTRLKIGKIDCIVLDIVDSTLRHNLVTIPTLLGLPQGVNLQGRSLIGVAKLVEDLQSQHPHVDFSTLKDIDQIHAFIEEMDLFAIRVKPEVETNSTFTWNPSYTGGYKLMLPDKDWVSIEQNLLDNFEIKAYIKSRKFRGERASLTEAFNAADGLVIKERPESIKVIKQEAEWHKLPMAPKQLKLLKKLMKGKPIPPTYTRGEASKKISELLAGKEK
jgi:superfamily II DNA or RNA helicase